MKITHIMNEIKQWDCNLVEVTGGEPLFQDKCINLLNELINRNYEVMLETGGSLSISDVPKKVIKIVDFKCPSSAMEKKNLWSIVEDLQPHDEVKFVIGNREDFDWAKDRITEYALDKICTLLFSPTFDTIDPQLMVEWILAENLPVRMQMQMHKMIWSPDKQGV
jgi:7-carboxy-7-deazaguanine synthase